MNHAAKIHYMFGGKVGVPMVIRTPGRRRQQLTASTRRASRSGSRTCPGLKVVAPSNPRPTPTAC